jgi:hypothetical protein
MTSATGKLVTEQAESRAKALHFPLVKEAANSSRTIVDAVKEAKKALEEDRAEARYAAIGRVVEEVEGLRIRLPS